MLNANVSLAFTEKKHLYQKMTVGRVTKILCRFLPHPDTEKVFFHMGLKTKGHSNLDLN